MASKLNKQTIVISPSGGWYGSEQMLFGHLQHSQDAYKVFIKSGGKLSTELEQLKKHEVVSFSDLKFFYLKIFFLLLFSKVNSVYVNEGGHINYVKMLSKIFKKTRFVVHVRLVEDCEQNRTIGLRPNVYLVCVSDFIRNRIIENNKSLNEKQVQTVHDFVLKPDEVPYHSPVVKGKIRIGVVGRVSSRKGVLNILTLLQNWEELGDQNKLVEVNLFGDVVEDDDVIKFREEITKLKNSKVIFHGFLNDRNSLYQDVDIIIHFNAFEPFPRIYFEALTYLVPVVGFRSGGIGEQAGIMGFDHHLVDFKEGWEKEMCLVISNVFEQLDGLQEKVHQSWEVFDEQLHVSKYMKSIEQLLDV